MCSLAEIGMLIVIIFILCFGFHPRSLFKICFSGFVMFYNGKIVFVAYLLLDGPFFLAQRIWIAGHCHTVFCFTAWQIAYFFWWMLVSSTLFWIDMHLWELVCSWRRISTFGLVIRRLCYVLFLFPVVTYISLTLPITGHKLSNEWYFVSNILEVATEISFGFVFIFWQSVVVHLISSVAWNFTSVVCCLISANTICWVGFVFSVQMQT